MMSRIDELVEETRLVRHIPPSYTRHISLSQRLQANSNNILRRNDGHVTPAPQHNDSALSSTTTKGKSHSAHSRNPPPRLSSPAEAADSRRKSKSRLAATGDETIISARPNRMDHRIDTSNLESTTLAAQVPPLSASSSSSSEAPRQTVMTRRVRATIETTVKEEEDSDTEEQILQAEKDYAEAQRKLVAPTPRSPTKRKAPRKSTYREDEDSDSPVTHRRQLSKRSKVMHSVHDDDDEDDEDGLEPLGGEVLTPLLRRYHGLMGYRSCMMMLHERFTLHHRHVVATSSEQLHRPNVFQLRKTEAERQASELDNGPGRSYAEPGQANAAPSTSLLILLRYHFHHSYRALL